MSETIKPQSAKPKEGFDVELSSEHYEKEDYNDYPKATGKQKFMLIGLLAGVALIFLFVVLAVGF